MYIEVELSRLYCLVSISRIRVQRQSLIMPSSQSPWWRYYLLVARITQVFREKIEMGSDEMYFERHSRYNLVVIWQMDNLLDIRGFALTEKTVNTLK